MRAALDLEPCPPEDIVFFDEPAIDEPGFGQALDEPGASRAGTPRPPASGGIALVAVVALVVAAAALGAAFQARHRVPARAVTHVPPASALPRAAEVVVADQPVAASYTARYGANYQAASGGYRSVDATITRASLGRYTVTLAGLGAPGGAAAASAIDSTECVAPRWGAVGPDEVIDVWCDLGRVPVDREFIVWFTPS